MLGFILSKLNLLILVTAIFVTVTYFLFSLSNMMTQNQAQLLLQRISREATTLLTSTTYCDKIVINIPDYFSVMGNRTFYYLLRIGVADSDRNPENGNLLVFSISSKEDVNTILAAVSIPTFARIYLAKRKNGGWDIIDTSDPNVDLTNTYIELDPQKLSPINAFTFIKKVIQGEQHLFIIPCSRAATETTTETCDAEIWEAFKEGICERLKEEYNIYKCDIQNNTIINEEVREFRCGWAECSCSIEDGKVKCTCG